MAERKERLRKFFFPDEYVRSSPKQEGEATPQAYKDSLSTWRSLAEWLGIDPESDPNAMQEATYYTCLKILREAIGRMPVVLNRMSDENGVRRAREHPLYTCLLRRPNRFTSATSFWSTVEQARLHYGNAYVLVSGHGIPQDPYELWYMPYEEVEVWWDHACSIDSVPDVYYIWSAGGRMRVFKSSEVLHFRSSDSYDGIMGIPLIERLDNLVNGGLKAQRFQNDLIASGMTGKAVLQYAGEVSPENEARFKRHIEQYMRGEKDGSGNVVPIPVGSQLTPLNLKLSDSQFEELKKYNAIQIAAAFGIKPQQIGDMTKTSYASSQAQNEAFYTDTLLFIVKGYEEEITSKCLTQAEQQLGYEVNFDTSTTLMASWKEEVAAAVEGIAGGAVSPDEARKRLNLPTMPGGDRLYANGSLIPLEMAGIQYAKTPEAAGGGEQQ